MCGCMDALTKIQEFEGVKSNFKFLDTGRIINLEANTERIAPVLRALREGKNGHLNVGQPWIEIKFCPLCGLKIDTKIEVVIGRSV